MSASSSRLHKRVESKESGKTIDQQIQDLNKSPTKDVVISRNGRKITDQEIDTLKRSFTGTLDRFRTGATEITEKQTRDLIAALLRNPGVTSLTLSHIKWTSATLRLLSDALPRLTSLTFLTMNASDIGAEGMSILNTKLSLIPSLVHLDFRCSFLELEGLGTLLVDLLPQMKKIQTLKYDGNVDASANFGYKQFQTLIKSKLIGVFRSQQLWQRTYYGGEPIDERYGYLPFLAPTKDSPAIKQRALPNERIEFALRDYNGDRGMGLLMSYLNASFDCRSLIPYLDQWVNEHLHNIDKLIHQNSVLDLRDVADHKQQSQSNVNNSERSNSQKSILSALHDQAVANKSQPGSASSADIKKEEKASSADDFNQDMKGYIASYKNRTDPCLELKLTEQEMKLFEERGLCDKISDEPMWMPVAVRGKTMSLSHISNPSIRRDESGTRICPLTNRPFLLNAIQPSMDIRDSIDELIEQIKQNRKKETSAQAVNQELPAAPGGPVKRS